MEIVEDSDLQSFFCDITRHKIIFFTKNNENFVNYNIMRLFDVQKILGEVKKLFNYKIF